MINAYANPAQNTVFQSLSQVILPGIRICQVASDTNTPYFLSAKQLTFYTDPRTGLESYIDNADTAYNNLTNGNPPYGTNILFDCCVSSSVDFFTDCYTNLQHCPTLYRLRLQIPGYYAGWQINFDCIDIAPSIQIASGNGLYIPFYLINDGGILAYGNNGYPSNQSDPNFDEAYLIFCDNFQYWPHKLVLFSYEMFENGTDTVKLFYGAYDNQVGGSRGRWRVDLNRGISSVSVGWYSYYDTSGTYIPQKSGYSCFFNLGYEAIPWGSYASYWDPSGNRLRTRALAYVNIGFNFQLQVTNAQVLFTWLNIITVFLSVISSSTALIHIVVGPGEYDPKGLLNKFFFFDVPVLRDAASDTALASMGKNKKKKADADAEVNVDEVEMTNHV